MSPYIEKQRRANFDNRIDSLVEQNPNEGDLNYIITRLLYLWCKPCCGYAAYNAVIGILECVKAEFYRRVVAEYEDSKCTENGEVFE